MSSPDREFMPRPAEIVAARPLTVETTLFRLRLSGEAPLRFAPGQFIQLSVPAGGEIPVSPASAPEEGNGLELCVRRVGHVTGMLHGTGVGSCLGVRGPFGKGFPVDEMAGEDVLLLAGGLGIAPLRSLLRHLLASRERFGAITFMYGAREPAAMLFRDELVELSRGGRFRLFLTVDFAPEEPPGGSACAVGLLPDLLKGVTFDPARTAIAVCGPPPLYRCLVGELEELGCRPDRIYLSLERRMKCGVGRCCHCTVGGLLCCTDGPVFRLSDLQGIREAL